MKYRILIITSFIIIAFLGTRNALIAADCPLEIGQSYVGSNSPAVYYISSGCKKRPMRNPNIFFSYFTSWNEVNRISSARLQEIANHELGFLPWGPRRDFENGSLIKTTDDPRVYLKINKNIYPIGSADAFTRVGFKWTWIEDVAPEVIEKYNKQKIINSIDEYPQYMAFKYEESPDVYLLEEVEGKQMKRHVKTLEEFNNMGYRKDRIATFPIELQFDDVNGTVSPSVSDKERITRENSQPTSVLIPSTIQKSVTDSGMISLTYKNIEHITFSEFENEGRLQVALLDGCYEKMKQVSGIEPIGDKIILKVEITDGPSNFTARTDTENNRIVMTQRQQSKEDLARQYERMKKGIPCQDNLGSFITYAHELGHAFSSMRHPLQEGLANWLAIRSANLKYEPFVCKQGGYTFQQVYPNSIIRGEERTYVDFGSRIDYGTQTCMWMDIEKNYGISTVQDILQDGVDQPDLTLKEFFSDVIMARTGNDIKELFINKYGVSQEMF